MEKTGTIPVQKLEPKFDTSFKYLELPNYIPPQSEVFEWSGKLRLQRHKLPWPTWPFFIRP